MGTGVGIVGWSVAFQKALVMGNCDYLFDSGTFLVRGVTSARIQELAVARLVSGRNLCGIPAHGNAADFDGETMVAAGG